MITAPKVAVYHESTGEGFDCIKMQDEAALAIYEEIKDMTPGEKLAYWAEQTRLMREEQQRHRAQRGERAQLSAP